MEKGLWRVTPVNFPLLAVRHEINGLDVSGIYPKATLFTLRSLLSNLRPSHIVKGAIALLTT
jgi:hypothetical protein